VTASGLCLALAVTLQQLILTKGRVSNFKSLDPMSLVFYTTPVEMGLLTPAFMLIEWPYFTERNQATITTQFLLLLIFLDATCVFLLRWVQNVTIKSTSALTLTVISQIKFVIVITISSAFFNYSIDLTKIIGLCLLIFGTSSYGILRIYKAKVVKTPPQPRFTNKILVV